ncbi:MAG: carbonic anhydrase [candidate division Zixibacteria bacterium]|nr:carbonic anhydrase [Candidatus Tariuqbacter arcticus]
MTITPQEALIKLKRGNERFITEKSTFPRVNAQRRSETTAKGQKPFATIITCSDSRTPPEYIFDQGIGDLFVIRVAGNICDKAALGSVELGVEHIGTSLVVVLGHRNCGIISMAIENIEMSEAVDGITAKIKPAILSVRTKNPELTGAELLEAAAKENALNAMNDIINGSQIIRRAVRLKRVELTAAYYDIENGEIEWLGS